MHLLIYKSKLDNSICFLKDLAILSSIWLVSAQYNARFVFYWMIEISYDFYDFLHEPCADIYYKYSWISDTMLKIFDTFHVMDFVPLIPSDFNSNLSYWTVNKISRHLMSENDKLFDYPFWLLGMQRYIKTVLNYATQRRRLINWQWLISIVMSKAKKY